MPRLDHVHVWRKVGRPARDEGPRVRNWKCACGASKRKISTGSRPPRTGVTTIEGEPPCLG